MIKNRLGIVIYKNSDLHNFNWNINSIIYVNENFTEHPTLIRDRWINGNLFGISLEITEKWEKIN